jgi:hypothetical protein
MFQAARREVPMAVQESIDESSRVVVDVDTVEQIFAAPTADPFSTSTTVALGYAALDQAVLHLQVHPLRKWDGAPLVVRLPEEQISIDLETRLAGAIQRYCAARIEDNRLRLHLSRKQRSFGLVVACVVVLVVILAAILLLNTFLADLPAGTQAIIVSATSLFAWVTIWGPLEALLFEWAAPARENRALAQIMNMQVIVKSRP